LAIFQPIELTGQAKYQGRSQPFFSVFSAFFAVK